MKSGLHPVAKLITLIWIAASIVFLTWCTFLALVGGTAPLVGLSFKRGFGGTFAEHALTYSHVRRRLYLLRT